MHDERDGRGGVPPLARLGRRLREARESRFTLKELSERSGISIGLISEVERGKGNPSFRTLYSISRALGLQIGDLIGEQPETSSPSLVRRHERKRLQIGEEGLVYQLLTPNLQGQLEVLETQLPPGFDNQNAPFQHIGEECVMVRDGSVEVSIAGVMYVLEEGDAITYDSGLPHWWRNATDRAVTVLGVVTPPSF